MTDSMADQEKLRKPKMTRQECIDHLCFLNEQRTNLLMESIENGRIDEIKNSQDKESMKQKFFFLVNAKASDRLFAAKQVNSEELSFASRFYKAD